jgi:Flp pilus assembly protein TadG
MIRQQGFRAKFKSRQQGAVAIIVAICLVVLVGMLGLVLDLGHLYVTKTELQNAADASALSGAKELVGTAAGIDSAVAYAKATAKKNKFKFSSTEVMISDEDIKFSCTPDGPWDSAASAKGSSTSPCQAGPVDKYFIKVDTASGNIGVWFIQVLSNNIPGLSTSAMAVAGRFITNILPLGVCAIDPDNAVKWVQYGTDATDNYKLEYGFARGVNYNYGMINNAIGGLFSGDPLYLHPTAKSVAECKPNQNNAGYPVPFMCSGGSTITGAGYAFGNTGWGGQDIYDAINTRFEFSSNLNKYGLNTNTCRPDANIREYDSTVASSGWMTSTQPPIEEAAIFKLSDWLTNRVGNVDTIKNDNEDKNKPTGGCNQTGSGGGADCTDNYGVLWSYARPLKQSGSLIASSDWVTGNVNTSLYPEGPSAQNYPSTGYDPTGLNLAASPYAQGLANKSGPYYQAGPGGQVGRRILNMVILDCKNVVKNPGCDAVPILAIGKFFMQKKASFTDKDAGGEFAGLISTKELSQDIHLYH